MPHKHSIKTYIKDGYYHAYNRGVDKRDIFIDDQDYRVFLHLLKFYLSDEVDNNYHPLLTLNIKYARPRPLESLGKEIEVVAFCLMPNHFHLLIHQNTIDGMPKLMRRLLTTYSMYFNKRYDRVGHLYQGTYKAVIISNDAYLLHLSRYIHLNPNELTGSLPVNYPYSSYQYYLGKKKADWVKPDIILNFFKDKNRPFPILKKHSYEEFVEAGKIDSRESLGDLSLD
jgi:putative transposase